jgi:sterol desaturase/sphingolipid hydroxylase (fatty acid hydroxylase superfamily)
VTAVLTGERAPVFAPGRRDRRARVGAWAGCVAVSVLAVWLGLEGGGALARSHGVYHTLAVTELRTVGPALFVVVAVLFALERRWPAVPRPVRSRAHVVDAAYLLVAAVIAPLVTLVDTGFAVVVSQHAPYLVLGRLPLGPRVVAVVLTLLGIDWVNWAVHVANHRSRSLWRFHALHHSQEEMSVFTTFRTHPFTHVSFAPAVLPAVLLAASGAVPAWALVAYGCFVVLPHANLPWTLGPLGKVVVSPAYHRLHHASAPVGGRPTVNFGFVLTFWDRLAGLAVDPVPGAPVVTGIRSRAVPVEQAHPTRPVLSVVGSQLVQPFRVGQSLDGRP